MRFDVLRLVAAAFVASLFLFACGEEGGDGDSLASSCMEIVQCWDSCADETCQKACEDGAPDEAIAAYDALWACFAFDSACETMDASCLQQDCPDELAACEG
jgi:hypothetical protein